MPAPDVTAQAKVNADATLGDLGLLLVPGTKRKWDVTPFSPQVRQTSPRYNDFSVEFTWVMESWHHGRGALELEDPFSFYDSRGVDTRIRGQLILLPLQNLTQITGPATVGGNLVKMILAAAAGTLYAVTGGTSRDTFTWDNGNTLWVDTTSGLSADPTDIAEFLGIVYVAQGEANVMRQRTLSSGVWADAGVPANFLAVGAVGTATGNVMWRADNINELYWTVDGSTWNGPIYAGNTNTQIRALLIHDGKLWVGKDDGLYVVQDGRCYQLWDCSFARDDNNFRWMKVWQGAIYFPVLNGLYRLIGGSTVQAVGPNRGAAGSVDLTNMATEREQRTYKSLASGRTGQLVDLIPTESFLYAVIDGGTAGTSQILAYNGVGWHQMAEGAAANNRIRAAFFTSVLASSGTLSIPRLWFGYANDIYNIILPDGTEDPFEYSSETYIDGGASVYLDTPWWDGGLANVYKEFHSVEVYSENLAVSNEVLQTAYEVDDIGSFQNLVDSSLTNYPFTNSPFQRINFPAHTTGKRLRLRLLPDRGSTNTETPKIKKVIVRGVLRPDTKYAWQMTARAGQGLINAWTKTKEDVDPAEWRQRLEQLRDSRTRLPFDDGELEPGITNLVLNSQFRRSSGGLASNWNEVDNPTTTISLIRKRFGVQSQKVVTDDTTAQGVETDSITTVAGTRYTASIYLYLESGDAVTLEFRNQTGGVVLASAKRTATTSDFVRLEVTAYATTTASRLRVVRNAADATQNTTFYVSAAQVEALPDKWLDTHELKATTYCDGEQPRCTWDGTPHVGTASRPGTVQVFVTNISSTEVKRPSIPDMIRGRGMEYRTTLTVIEVPN